MPTSRRTFIQTAAVGTAALTAAGLTRRASAAAPTGVSELAWGELKKSGRSLNILFMGGTGFLGPHCVAYATMRGHTVTMFNRGNRDEMFPDLETIIGNRDPDIDPGLNPLKELIDAGRRWDVVIDTSAYVQRTARASSELLKGACDQYIFISSICAYKDWGTNMYGDETLPLDTLDDETEENVGQFYCQLQAICEREYTKVHGPGTTIIRPGLIVGPRDFSDRFTYWPLRVERGGEVLAPGRPTDPMAWIDVRDLAAFVITAAENNATGGFNCIGPNHASDTAELLYGCKAVTGGDATFTWIDDDQFLLDQGLNAWAELPAWAAPGSPLGGAATYSNAKAIAAGMNCRPLAETVQATLEFYHSLPEERQAQPRAGMSAEKEAEVLKAWHNR